MPSLFATPVYMDKKTLFAPANGRMYDRDDFHRCCAQQPFPLIPRYLWAKNCVELKPPTLNYGFIMDKAALMKVVCEHFPDAVSYEPEEFDDSEGEGEAVGSRPHPEFGVYHHTDSEEDGGGKGEEESPRGRRGIKYQGEVPNVDDTLASDWLSDAIEEYFKTPSGLVSVELLATPEGEYAYGLSFGSNYTGLVSRSLLPKIREVFGIPPELEPQWYLNPCGWYWTRVHARRPKPKHD